MQSFVRTLVESRESASGALANVLDEVVGGISSQPAARVEEPGYADGLVRRALLREAVATLSGSGHVPLVIGDALWSRSLESAPVDHAPRSLCLVVPADRLRSCIESMTARGFVLHRDSEADWFSLEGLPALLCLRSQLRDPIAPFRMDLDRVRSRAMLDEHTYGAPAFRPSAEDGLCAWAIEASEALLHGRSPHWLDPTAWQARYPSDAERLRACAEEHGVRRLLPTLLLAAHDVSGDPAMASLAKAVGCGPLTALAARLCLRSFDGSVLDRRVGALVLYGLAPNVRTAQRALAERGLKVAARAVSKM